MSAGDFPVPQFRISSRPDATSPRRILVLGDFSGRRFRTEQPDRENERSIITVDLDNFDKVLARLRPTLSVSMVESQEMTAPAEFRSLEDFHPDGLFQQLDPLKSLWAAREQLLGGASNVTTREELADLSSTAAGAETGGPTGAESPPPPEDDHATLDRLLGQRPAAVSRPSGRQKVPGLTAWLKQLVDPHVVPAHEPGRKNLVKAYDETAARLLRYIMHQPSFQALESLWRSVHWILREVESDGRVEFDLLDVTQAEVAADLQATADWRDSGLYRRLEGAGRSWSLLVGDFVFGNRPDDVLLLASLGAIAAELQAPFLSAARPEVCGCQSPDALADPGRWQPIAASREESWQKLRSSEMARWLGLAMPRILLRLPYGTATDPIDQFPFEEMTAPENHEELLWGNPALACAYLCARTIGEGRGTDDICLELDDLPPYTIRDEEGTHLKACSEVYLSDRATEAILAHGVMPLVSHRNRNAVRLARWQSLAEPPSSLKIRS